MEVFQNLKIILPNEANIPLKMYLVQKAESIGWIHREDFEQNYKKNTASESEK